MEGQREDCHPARELLLLGDRTEIVARKPGSYPCKIKEIINMKKN
jgi:hypothetical protein